MCWQWLRATEQIDCTDIERQHALEELESTEWFGFEETDCVRIDCNRVREYGADICDQCMICQEDV